MPARLSPAQLAVLRSVSRHDVWLNRLASGRRRWFIDQRPDTAAIDCLIADGLVESEPDAIGIAMLTGAGRAALNQADTTNGER